MSCSYEFFSLPTEAVTVNKKEAFRYMGHTGKTVNGDMEKLYSDCLFLFEKAVSYKAVYRKTDILLKGDGVIDLGFGEFRSLHLERNLEGCKSAYIFAATVGIDTDRLIMRLSKTNIAESIVADAIGSAAVEDFCDILNDKLREGKECKPRFSCGYGDFGIENQKSILEFLNAYRKIGITLSDSFMMTPKKSVTAIVGIKGE